MNKRHLRHILKNIRQVRTWYFVVAIIIAATVSVIALRQNNIEAIKLRDTVLQVDKDNGDIDTALRDLRKYVYGHMNSNLSSPNGAYPPIQLKYRYDRLVAEQKTKAPSNTGLATEAQNYCEKQIPTGRSLNRIDCIQNYILTHGSSAATPSIPDALYKFDFAAPFWSPDLAGWSLVLLAVLILLFIVRIAAVTWLKHLLHD